jgi:hypothetical protein
VAIFKKFSWFSAGLFLITAILLTTCKNEENELGLNLQPPGDKLGVKSTDTTTVIAYSQIVDSVKTDETSVSLLGSLLDPVFGKSTASFYTQLRLSKAAFDFGATPFPDSLILRLAYAGIYGDTTAPMTIKVYELADELFVDSSYYSKNTLATNSTLLAQKTFTPNFTDSVAVVGDKLPAHLRINLTSLTSELASKLINVPDSTMASNTAFLEYFHGLYVTAEPANSGGSILYFDLMSVLSGMTLYYHNALHDSLSFQYVINSSCARFGNFTHDYSLGDPSFKAQVIDKDTSLGKSICYVQALAGVKTFVRFPNIKDYYSNGKIAVNEARFFIYANEPDAELDVASTLVMVTRTADSSYAITKDQLEGANYYGGFYDKNHHGYWFRITSTVQDLMRSTDPDYGFEIYISGGAINAQRVLLDGTNPPLPVAPEDRMKLVITYTSVN